MNALDKSIRAALAADESELLRQFDEPSLPEQVLETFRGRSRWLVTLAILIAIGGGAFAVFSAVRFFQAEDIQEMIAWAGGFGLSVITTALTKIWYWMELNKYVLAREIKRVELQIARLASQLGKS